MRKIFIFYILIFTPSIFLIAQVEIKSAIFIPPEYYIGDAVELRIHIELDDYKEVIHPENILFSEWIELTNIQINQDNTDIEIIIDFTSFSPGTRTLPEIDFDAFILRDFKIYTKSLIVQGENEIKGLRPQVLIPGSKLYFVLLTATVLILPYFLFFLIKLLFRKTVSLIRRYHSTRPYRGLKKTFKKLNANLDNISVRDFFIMLTDSLRIYLSSRSGFDCKSATTSEISLLHGFGLEEGLWNRLVSVLKRGDMVKFGGEQISYNQMKENLEFVISTCQEIEKKEDFHANL